MKQEYELKDDGILYCDGYPTECSSQQKNPLNSNLKERQCGRKCAKFEINTNIKNEALSVTLHCCKREIELKEEIK